MMAPPRPRGARRRDGEDGGGSKARIKNTNYSMLSKTKEKTLSR